MKVEHEVVHNEVSIYERVTFLETKVKLLEKQLHEMEAILHELMIPKAMPDMSDPTPVPQYGDIELAKAIEYYNKPIGSSVYDQFNLD